MASGKALKRAQNGGGMPRLGRFFGEMESAAVPTDTPSAIAESAAVPAGVPGAASASDEARR